VTVPSAGDAAGRLSMTSLLQEPSYRRLWASGLLVNVARWIDLVTLGWLALQLTGSPFMVGLAAFARSAPLMVVGPFAGIVADRMPRGRVLTIAQATGLIASLGLAVIFVVWGGRYGILVAFEVAFGLAWALDFPARRTSLYALLGAPRVAQAVSLETVSMQIAKVLGPLAAGWCLARMGPAACYALMAVMYAGALGACVGLSSKLGTPGVTMPVSVGASMRAGLAAAWASGTVKAVLLVTIAMNTLFFPYQHMLPVFARDVLDVGPLALGALVAADGLGALVGALVIASGWGRLDHRTIFGSAVMMLVMGAAESGFATMQSTLVLLSAPERLRGAVMGILSACIGTQPLGTLAIGLLAASLGSPRAFTLNALVSLAVIVPLAIPLIRRRT
jgi:MFS family permease